MWSCCKGQWHEYTVVASSMKLLKGQVVFSYRRGKWCELTVVALAGVILARRIAPLMSTLEHFVLQPCKHMERKDSQARHASSDVETGFGSATELWNVRLCPQFLRNSCCRPDIWKTYMSCQKKPQSRDLAYYMPKWMRTCAKVFVDEPEGKNWLAQRDIGLKHVVVHNLEKIANTLVSSTRLSIPLYQTDWSVYQKSQT